MEIDYVLQRCRHGIQHQFLLSPLPPKCTTVDQLKKKAPPNVVNLFLKIKTVDVHQTNDLGHSNMDTEHG